MKNIFLITIAFSFIVFTSASAFGEQIEGTVQGFNCVTSGKICPLDKDDPAASAERAFVILEENGTDFYFVPVLGREDMVRHLLEKVRITGETDEKYNAIAATSLEVWNGDEWEVVWPIGLSNDWGEKLFIYTIGM